MSKVKLGNTLPEKIYAQVMEVTGTVTMSFLVTNEGDYQLVRDAFDDMVQWADDCSMPSCSKVKTQFTAQNKAVKWDDGRGPSYIERNQDEV